MTHPALADHTNISIDKPHPITRATILKVFAIVTVISFALRIIYIGHLYEDDGLWFTAAEELVRGRALYGEIYFDKPPGLVLVYALLFTVFGAHIVVIRLFTIAYSIAIAAIVYLFGARLYDKRIGLISAVMFAVFSTTYSTGHVQSLSTDLMMALPYTAGAYFMYRAMTTRNALLAAVGGALAGLAFQINPKAIFDLVFFGVVLIASRKWTRKQRAARSEDTLSGSHAKLLALAVAGFVVASAPFLIYIAANKSLHAYWLYVWNWGSRYSSYYGAGRTVLLAISRTADYLALNNTLLIAAGFVVVSMLRRSRQIHNDAKQAPAASSRAAAFARSDATLLIWLTVSYAGLMTGGRFFGHYFIQLLPALSLISARGLTGIHEALSRKRSMMRRAVVGLLAIGFVFTLVRFHGRGALLAADVIRGKASDANSSWYYNERAREERAVAAIVRDLPAENAVETLGLEAIRAGGPRTRAADGPSDYLFVWGYRPEIYFWSGLLPASRFLSTQPLTGVPADVHYFGDDYRSVLAPAVTARAREQLLEDLETTQPKYIVDEIGFFNNDLAILQYSELREFMSEYKPLGATGRFFIYRRKDLSSKYRLRHNEDQR